MDQATELEPLAFDFESADSRVAARDQLTTHGYLCLRQAAGRQNAETVAMHVWEYLEAVDVYRDRKASWPIGKPSRGPVFRAIRD